MSSVAMERSPESGCSPLHPGPGSLPPSSVLTYAVIILTPRSRKAEARQILSQEPGIKHSQTARDYHPVTERFSGRRCIIAARAYD